MKKCAQRSLDGLRDFVHHFDKNASWTDVWIPQTDARARMLFYPFGALLHRLHHKHNSLDFPQACESIKPRTAKINISSFNVVAEDIDVITKHCARVSSRVSRFKHTHNFPEQLWRIRECWIVATDESCRQMKRFYSFRRAIHHALKSPI